MSPCNCGDDGRTVKTRHGRRVRLSVLHERLAMCCMCLHAEHDGTFWGRGPDRCGLSGHDVMDMVTRRGCPRNKFPRGPRSVTRWAWMRWYGVPYPVRLVVWAAGAHHRPPSRWHGCGCLVWAKDLWLAVRAALAS